MTIKEYNTIRRAAYDAALQIPEIADKMCAADELLLFEITQLPDKRAFLPLAYRSQLNDNTLREIGFDSNRAEARLVMTLNRKTKCASW